MKERSPRRSRRLAAAAVALAGVVGCASSSSLHFRCDNPINGGLLLTVDVVRATEAQARQIETLGEKWFYDPMRDGLRDHTTTVTFPTKDSSGMCERSVSVKAEGKEKYLVIIADYKYQSPDASRQIVSLPKERWSGKTLDIAVHDRELSVSAR
jgi:predicted component of type VI protein secretion system